MSEEMWHVQIEPGEVKHLTLEQLDDMFRLDLISGDTLVWQPGMAKALPLSVVAGIDDDEEEESDVMEIEPELIPEPAHSSRSVAPASVGYRASAAVSAWPAAPAPASVRPAPAASFASTYPSAAPAYPVAASTYPAAPSTYPAAPSTYPAAASAYPSVAPAPAPASVRQPTMQPPSAASTALAPVVKAPIAPAMPSPDIYSPESLRPITMSEIPALRGQGGGLTGKVLIGVAIAAGLLVTLHRNDLLRPMAESAGQKSAYERIESALGAPSFGTPQAVTQMSSMLNPATVAAVADTATTPSTTPSTSTTTSDSDSTDSSDSSESSDSSDSSTSHASQPAKKPQATAPVRRASGSAPAPRAKAKEPSGKGLKAYKGSEYDPMNAKL